LVPAQVTVTKSQVLESARGDREQTRAAATAALDRDLAARDQGDGLEGGRLAHGETCALGCGVQLSRGQRAARRPAGRPQHRARRDEFLCILGRLLGALDPDPADLLPARCALAALGAVAHAPGLRPAGVEETVFELSGAQLR
jgi:hypothetical protein